MKVKELIVKLQQFNPDLEVIVNDVGTYIRIFVDNGYAGKTQDGKSITKKFLYINTEP